MKGITVTHRERVLRAINFQNPDKIPLAVGVDLPELFRYGQRFLDLCQKYPNDFSAPDSLKIPERDEAHYRPDGTYYREYTDGWGSEWVSLEQGFSGEVVRPVLDDWSKLKTLKSPPVPDSSPADRKRLREAMKKQKETYVGLMYGGCLFQTMMDVRGMENCLMDIASDCEEIYILADLQLQRMLTTIEIALEAGVDVVRFADDWGTQTGLFINPASWRKIFKPRYQKMFDLVRQGGAIPWMHSCGMTMEIIPDWIEMGLKVLEPQLGCMNMRELQRLTAGKLCIDGSLDFQKILPFGTPEQVRGYISEVTSIFGSPQGGFIYQLYLCDSSVENAEAALRTIYEVRNLWDSNM
jgi:uroporphyrinogen decarboxylase